MILLKSQDQADQKGGGTTCHFIEQDCEELSFVKIHFPRNIAFTWSEKCFMHWNLSSNSILFVLFILWNQNGVGKNWPSLLL